MDRTQQRPTRHKDLISQPAFSVDSALFSIPSDEPGCDFPHTIFAPLHYEPGYAYPLIVWLHGPDDNERQLLRIMPLISMRNYLAVSPRAPLAGSEREDCYQWQQTDENTRQAEQRVFACVEAARKRFRVAPGRIFLAGFDFGGTMAFRVALDNPDRFAGVLSFGGRLPSGHNPFGRLTEARNLPIFLAGGRDSGEYPPEAVCDDLRLCHTAGMSITLRQYPCGQELAPQMLRDMDRWIIEQITAGADSSADSDPSWSRSPD